VLGCKIVPIPTDDGKLRLDDIAAHLHGFGDVHHAQPRVISVSQSTELGTVYTPDELRAIADLAHAKGMLLHVDGARLANAAAALGVPLGVLGAAAGVDVMTLGGTKLGMLTGEAVAVFDEGLQERAGYFQKQGMQLVSKMRFVAAQFDALLTDDLWLDLATHANDMARQLSEQLDAVKGVSIVQPVQTNMVYARFPGHLAARVQQEVGPFHCPTSDHTVGRLVTAWDTQPSDIAAFVDAAARIAGER
jgi:threonine aldolase